MGPQSNTPGRRGLGFRSPDKVPPVIRRRVPAAVVVSLLAILPTAGCYQGFNSTVNDQGPSGNGTDVTVPPEVGTIKVQNATLVADPADPTVAGLIMTIINEGDSDDSLLSAELASGGAGATEGPVVVPAGRSVKVGGPDGQSAIAFTGLTVPTGSYAGITLTFRSAGSAVATVLVVPGVGYYADYKPTVDTQE